MNIMPGIKENDFAANKMKKLRKSTSTIKFGTAILIQFLLA